MSKIATAGRKKKENPPAKPRPPGPYFSRAVEKALLALDLIRQSPQPLPLQQIAAAIKLSKASAFRLLHTLEALHYLAKSHEGLYSTPSLSNQVASRAVHEMLRHGTALLERLAMEFRETASMAALFDNHIEVLAVVESPELIRMSNTPGRILPPNASSLGKAIAAFQPPDLTEKLVRSYGTYSFTPQTITDLIALRNEFARIRERGFAEDLEESTPGGHCIAAPILRPNGFAAGAVSLSLPLMRFQGEEHARTILAAVREAAVQIQKHIASF